MVTDKLRSYSSARSQLMPGNEHRSHKGLNNRAENSHLVVRRRERRMMRFKSARQCQRFVSTHGSIANLFLFTGHCCPPQTIASFALTPSRSGVKSLAQSLPEVHERRPHRALETAKATPPSRWNSPLT
jgi:putative transposase